MMEDLNQKNPSAGGAVKELKRCSSSSSSSSCSILPLESLIEILSRLPAKSLCRFRCVSKQWLHLLSSDSHFKSLHRRRSLSSPILLNCHTNPKDSSSRNEFSTQLTSVDSAGHLRDDFVLHGQFNVLASSFNLVCMDSGFGSSRHSIYICNLSTRQVVKVWASTPVEPPRRRSWVRPFRAALGVLPSLATYKLVLLFQYDFCRRPSCRCEVLTLVEGRVSPGSWRKIDSGFPERVSHCYQIIASVVGFIYWLIRGARRMVSLDLESERFGFINYPRDYMEFTAPALSLVELSGCLCLVDDSTAAANSLAVWRLVDRDHSIWVKDYTIDYPALATSMRVLHYIPSSEDHEDGQLLVLADGDNDDPSYYNYSPKKKCFQSSEIGRDLVGKKPVFYYDGLFSLRSRPMN